VFGFNIDPGVWPLTFEIGLEGGWSSSGISPDSRLLVLELELTGVALAFENLPGTKSTKSHEDSIGRLDGPEKVGR
jgi:hypothetical protein